MTQFRTGMAFLPIFGITPDTQRSNPGGGSPCQALGGDPVGRRKVSPGSRGRFTSPRKRSEGTSGNALEESTCARGALAPIALPIGSPRSRWSEVRVPMRPPARRTPRKAERPEAAGSRTQGGRATPQGARRPAWEVERASWPGRKPDMRAKNRPLPAK
jgi:hypothetical protein